MGAHHFAGKLGAKSPALWIKATRTQHGRHYYIKLNTPVDAHTANRLQYLLGDDPKRVAFNTARIKSRLSEWNKLFEGLGRRLITVYDESQGHLS